MFIYAQNRRPNHIVLLAGLPLPMAQASTGMVLLGQTQSCLPC